MWQVVVSRMPDAASWELAATWEAALHRCTYAVERVTSNFTDRCKKDIGEIKSNGEF